MTIKINLGCGKKIKEGWINVDRIKLHGVDVVHDLNDIPYPFDDSSVDDDIIVVMEELHRILKPNGILEIYVPYYKSKNAFTDPTHKHFFTEHSMDYFVNDTEKTVSGANKFNFYTKARFKIIKFEKYRGGFPFYHIKKHFHIDIKIPFMADTLHWVMKAMK